MQSHSKFSGLLNGCLNGAALFCVILSVLAVALGPEGRRFAGMPLNVFYSATCVVLCFAFCGVSLARYASRRRALVQVLERRHPES